MRSSARKRASMPPMRMLRASEVQKPAAGAPAAAPAATAAVEAPTSYRDSDFVESEHNRDPFRSLMVELAKTAKAPVTQRKVLMMDRGNLGHIVRRGDCVGKEKAVVKDIGTARGEDDRQDDTLAFVPGIAGELSASELLGNIEP